MMAIISDIHGNFEALKSVLDELDKMCIEEIYCLGDIVGYYSQVNECCDELRKREVKCVMGNHDWYMVSKTNCLRSHSVNDCLNYQRKIITKENYEWLTTFPIIRNVNGVSMVHGGWVNPLDEYLETSGTYFSTITNKYFASGHCHVQKICKYKNQVYCNPGSVGQPRDGDNRAAFATFDKGRFQLYRKKYDIDKTANYMETSGFGAYYYACLYDASQKLHV